MFNRYGGFDNFKTILNSTGAITRCVQIFQKTGFYTEILRKKPNAPNYYIYRSFIILFYAITRFYIFNK